MKKINFLLCIVLFTSCVKKNTPIVINSQSIVIIDNNKEKEITSNIENWLVQDIQIDTIPGISLLKATESFLKEKTGDTVIVALIDMPVNINHEGLKAHIWKNKNEIINNNIDDDKNGYIDDINGWNFIGNLKGENIVFMNYEYTRILKAHSKGKYSDSSILKQYNKAKIAHDSRTEYAIEAYENVKRMDSMFRQNKATINYLFPDEITKEKVDSVKLQNLKNKSLLDAIELFQLYQEEEIDEAYINETLLMAKNRIDVLLNVDFNDREKIGDNVNDLDNKDYGNNIVNHNLDVMTHGTLMAGIIVSHHNNETLRQIIGKIKIMPLCISGYGDENDKDMALAIKYAVDNGADIINISSGKYFSMHENWVQDAVRYANKKNVLVVTSSGNNGLDLNAPGISNYPNDFSFSTNSEISNNFIKVGGSNYKMDSTFVHPATNYGQSEVDIFAPGEEIFTTSSLNDSTYTYSSGTSAAAAVFTKSAAIIKSFYPNFTASELKEILMKTGVEYNINVKMYDSLDNKVNIPFKKLSKSGKIVNVHNALMLAELLSNNVSK